MKPKYSNEGGSFIMLRDEHLLVTKGNIVAAALIHVLEHWHYHKLDAIKQAREANEVAARHGERPDYPETLYQWHKTEDLERMIKGLGSKRTIQEARELLCGLGVISEHRNPNPRYSFDRTIHFLFHPDVLAELILQSEHCARPSEQITPRSDQKEQYPYITSINNNIDNVRDSSVADAPVDEKPDIKPDKKKKKTPGPADKDWQRWVDRYDEHVKKNNDGLPHRWGGDQLGPQGLKGIRAHLVNISIKIAGKSDDDCGFGAWSWVLDRWETLPDEWLRGVFDLTVILKKITEILNRLKNGATKSGGSSANGNGKLSPGAARFEAIKNY